MDEKAHVPGHPPPYAAVASAPAQLEMTELTDVKPSFAPSKKFILWVVVGAVIATVCIFVGVGIAVALTGDDGGDQTTPSSTTITELPTSSFSPTTTTAPPPGWNQWGAWSDCSETCGDGYQTRERDCGVETHLCVGQDEQIQECNDGKCDEPEYGQWSGWGSWGECTKTCDTGIQERIRVCHKEDEDLDCVGETSQTRNCNEFSCPDCGVTCPDGGSWDTECKRCECAGQTLQGKILTGSGTPIENARISHNTFPPEVISTSNADGNFTVTSMCLNAELYIERSGYLPAQHTVTALGETILLDAIDYLTISEHPEDKERLEGEGVTFCCAGQGNPPVSYYEWFHNDVLLDASLYPFGVTLQLSRVTTNESGNYRCRANNEYSSVYSHYAQLVVKSKTSDFCHSLPMSKIKPLPPGCSYEGGPEIDIGTCSGDPCRSDTETDNGKCSEEEGNDFCCTDIEFVTVEIMCMGGPFPISIIKECGCDTCRSGYVDIFGIATSVLDGSPVFWASVYVNQTQVATTDSYGKFSFAFSSTVRDITVEIEDSYSIFAPGVKTVDLSSATDNRVYFAVKMFPKQEPVEFDASTDQIISLKDPNQTIPFGELQIPANSVYSSDGTVHKGVVIASVASVDPRNILSMANSPSDLMFENNQGEVEPLKSYGMFNLDLQDDSGNSLSSNQITVGFNLDLVSTISNATEKVKLWDLNPKSGKWKLSGSLSTPNQTRDQFTMKNFISKPLDDINIGTVWYNFDSRPEDVCYSKIKLFDDENFNSFKQIRSTFPGVLILVDPASQTYDVSRVRAFSDNDNNPEAGFCIVHECRKPSNNVPTTGFIFAENEKKSLHPADPNIHLDPGIDESVRDDISYKIESISHSGVSFDVISVDLSLNAVADKGPYYDWDQSRTDTKKWAYTDCSSAPTSDNHFRFYIDKVISSCPEPSYVRDFPVVPANTAENEKLNLLSWFPKAPEDKYDICYVKVHVSNYNRHFFQAFSAVGTYSDSSRGIQAGSPYGLTHGCVDESKTEPQAICIEAKKSGEIHHFATPSDYCCEDETMVHIYAFHPSDTAAVTCQITEVNENITTATHNSTYFGMQIKQNELYGNNYGVYCVTNEATAVNARSVAKANCMNEVDDSSPGDDPDDTKANTWAVKFDCT